MGRSNISIPCPDCKTKLKRISYWDNTTNDNGKVNGDTKSNDWFICLKCNNTHQITYQFTKRSDKK